jgi:hypothetical protein
MAPDPIAQTPAKQALGFGVDLVPGQYEFQRVFERLIRDLKAQPSR